MGDYAETEATKTNKGRLVRIKNLWQHRIYVLGVLSLLLWLGVAGSLNAKTVVVWSTKTAIFAKEYPGNTKPVKLFTDKQWVDLDSLVPSPNGRYILRTDRRGGGEIYDLRQPGKRRSLNFDEEEQCCLKEWTSDSKSIVAIRFTPATDNALDVGDTLGIYSVGMNGKRTLLVKSDDLDFPQPTNVRYSPDGKMLALLSDEWVQIIELRTGKSPISQKYKRDGSGDWARFAAVVGNYTWLDDNSFIWAGDGCLLRADLSKRTIAHWAQDTAVLGVAYATKAHRTVASLQPKGEKQSYLCLVKSITGERQRIPIGISDPRLLGISSDGKLVLLTGSGDESPESFGSLWMVNLQLGSRSLIAKWEDWQGATLVEAMDKPIAVQNKP